MVWFCVFSWWDLQIVLLFVGLLSVGFMGLRFTVTAVDVCGLVFSLICELVVDCLRVWC